jgi:starch phosphorylase
MGREPGGSSDYDKYRSLALAVRERLMRDRLATERRLLARDPKSVHYLSLEFLMGRTLQNAILNLDIGEEARAVMGEMGKVLEDAYEEEHDAGLGNGGLGRLAACFLDSLATLAIPACGYGIRYEYGIFNQVIEGGRQVERPDYWLFRGNPWETARPEEIVRVRFHGRTRHEVDAGGRRRVAWLDTDDVLAMPYETLVPGFRNGVANPLILWSAEATEEFDLGCFNDGDYARAVEQKQWSETISKVLYPRDETGPGKELRLKQQYFFVSASLQRILRGFELRHRDLRELPDKVAIHLNDTHPAVAIPELMRILVDEHEMGWDEAWGVTTRTFAYTNHTLMPEALEKWGVPLFGNLLPRHLEVVYEINRRFLDEVEARYPGDGARKERMSLIDEGGARSVRMANLAIVGGHSVNGVAALHSDLLKRHTFRDFHEMWPERFSNKTNGVTQRRWLLQANPALARLITESIGPGWVRDLDELAELEPLADDAAFGETWASLKHGNKAVLAASLRDDLGVKVDPSSLFDVQVKRIHEYKRQLLNILQVAARYLALRDSASPGGVPRTVLIGGKAAPGYRMAKLIIELAHGVGRQINADPHTAALLKLVFLPNYRVSLAERIFPASDLSEQISTAGTEASGTGNMKFALNGALTIGTLDGANIEIRDAVGPDNIFIFGLTEEEVARRKAEGYAPRDVYRSNPDLKRVLDAVAQGAFSPDDPGRFRPLVDSLLDGGDPYMVLADFASYLRAQEEVDACHADPRTWTVRSIRNVAAMGFFSSDRTVTEYATRIWNTPPAVDPPLR